MSTVQTVTPVRNYAFDTLSSDLNSEASTVGTANGITMVSIRSDHFFKSRKTVIQELPACSVIAEDEEGVPFPSSQYQHTFNIVIEIFDTDMEEDTLQLKLETWSQAVQQILNDMTGTGLWGNTMHFINSVNVDYDPDFTGGEEGGPYVRHVLIVFNVLSRFGNFIT